MTTCCGDSTTNSTSAAPYLPKSFADPATNFFISPVLGYRPASTGTPAAARFLQFGLNITGTGTSQTSWFFVATGAFLDDGNGGLVQTGGFVGTRRGAANLTMGRASGPLSSAPGNVSVDSDFLPTSATITGVNYDSATKQYDNTNPPRFFLGGGAAAQDYTYTQIEQKIPTPTGLGSTRPTQTVASGAPLTGYIGGIMRSNPTTGTAQSFIIGNATHSPSDVVIQLDPSDSRMQANFNVSNRASSIGATSLSTAQYQFGSLDPVDRARSAYLDYDTFAARDARTGPSGNTDPLSTVNGLALDTSHGALVNIKGDLAQAIATGVGGSSTTICQCDYTRWGFWSMDDSRTVSGNVITDRGHMMLWVAGQRPPSASDVPASGTATYSGHVIANVRNAGNEYITGGNFTNTVNFGAATNQLTVSVGTSTDPFDGATYSGSLSLNSDRRDFSGVLTGTLSRTMTMNGSFFRGISSPVGEMGGGVAVTNTAGDYLASGIFAGKKQ
jgi:hypothetical protein